MKFQPGNKFGKGRPEGTGFVQHCRTWADENGWGKLQKMAASKNQRVALEATKVLLAYGYGKPREAVEISSPPPNRTFDFSGISTEKLEKFLDDTAHMTRL